jgi:hypothetical protein
MGRQGDGAREGSVEYFSEETTSAAAFAAVEVDVDVMIFAVDRFLHERFLEDLAIYR